MKFNIHVADRWIRIIDAKLINHFYDFYTYLLFERKKFAFELSRLINKKYGDVGFKSDCYVYFKEVKIIDDRSNLIKLSKKTHPWAQ
jgi:hypothetical protein